MRKRPDVWSKAAAPREDSALDLAVFMLVFVGFFLALNFLPEVFR